MQKRKKGLPETRKPDRIREKEDNTMAQEQNKEPVSDEELAKLTGGAKAANSGSSRTFKQDCPLCHAKAVTFTYLSGTRAKGSCGCLIEA